MATDPLAIVRAWLAADVNMAATFGNRIWAAANLPPKYKPDAGPACLFAPRGGGIDYSSSVWQPSLQFRVYAETEIAAWNAWQVLFAAANDKQANQIKWSRMESGTFPAPLTEPGLDWSFVLGFFRMHITAR